MSSRDLLLELHQELESLVGSLPLTAHYTDIVPGEGTVGASILFIGEAPGFQETVERRPFVGRSGKLLRNTIETVGLEPNQYYITNIVKARPPENRDPLPQEIAAYKPFLDREIEILSPAVVVTLGRLSMAKFLPNVKISQVHGKLHKVLWNGKRVFVLPMYHPAAALRATRVKDAFIADFSKIQNILTWIDKQVQEDTFEESMVEALI